MSTLPYSDLLAQVEALAGASLATPEKARVKIFANRRARKAHRECDYWPHLLRVGEERIVSEDGLLPLEQPGLQTIDKIIRIHAQDPFKSQAVYEYTEYYHDVTGIQIAGYEKAELSTGADMIVTDANNPDINGRYRAISFESQRGSPLLATYQSLSNLQDYLTPLVSTSGGSGAPTIYSYAWQAGDPFSADYWQSDSESDATSPNLASGFNPIGSADGDIVVTEDIVYSAFVTYLAGIPATYGDGESEESDVPEPWFEYMAQGAYTDWLRSDGQTEKAMAEEVIAESLLNQQLEKVSRSNGNQVITRIMSHGTKQSR